MTAKNLPRDKEWDIFWSDGRKPEGVSRSKQRIISVLSRYLDGRSVVLDAGCGSGFFSKYFCDKGFKTYSLDYSDEALAVASRLTSGKASIIKADLLTDKLKEKLNVKFDIVFSDGLFEHFLPSQQDAIMANLKSVLNAGGLLVTFVPNKFSPWQIIRPFYMPSIREIPFTNKMLADLNVRNNLKIVEEGGINVLPFHLSPEAIFGKVFGMLLYSVSFDISNVKDS